MSSATIRTRLAAVKSDIREIANRAGRSLDDIRLIAVSKTRSLDEVKQAIDAGQRDFGENTIQDALTKVPELGDRDVRWHFIGHLQSKKARQIPHNFHWVHSVDSIKLAQKLSNAMVNAEVDTRINCLIQANVSAEASKAGLDKTEILPFLDELLRLELPGISWRGLMTIGVQGDDYQTRSAFAELRQLLGQCRYEFGLNDFDQLSMGMSNDYAIAIEEGATMVRVGTAIFGERNRK
jgi:pyridoxal phosphate enzyme (YggS family)